MQSAAGLPGPGTTARACQAVCFKHKKTRAGRRASAAPIIRHPRQHVSKISAGGHKICAALQRGRRRMAAARQGKGTGSLRRRCRPRGFKRPRLGRHGKGRREKKTLKMPAPRFEALPGSLLANRGRRRASAPFSNAQDVRCAVDRIVGQGESGMPLLPANGCVQIISIAQEAAGRPMRSALPRGRHGAPAAAANAKGRA